ncbi:unnamed protein product [Linum tenue]|uniref:Uncharacterized protein n=1 Tax=Linum tenue TaxID=586396 RepID=A0AAV0HLM9_9ROSI|nr:unnamed protein product [Linum tenue]
MRLPPRRILASNKRKDKEDTTRDSSKSSAPPPLPPSLSLVATMEPVIKPATAVIGYDKFTEPVGSNNQLLAGYLAHEFLSKGTLFGEPMRADNCPSPIYVKAKKIKPSMERETKAMVKSEQNIEDIGKRSERYLEVSKLLKMEGAHLPGIINPTQLAQFLQM